MCLIDYRKTKEDEYSGVGYKIFCKNSNGGIIGEYGPAAMKPRPVSKWLYMSKFQLTEKEKKSSIFGSFFSFIKYKPGWHVYLTKPQLVDSQYSIRKVKYRKGRLIGYSTNYRGIDVQSLPAVVADKIFIERKK